jgi:nitrate reductase alpha subunit
MTSGMNRRGFLQAAATGTASLALGIWKLQPREALGQTTSQAAGIPEYTSWADVYRGKWTWDKVARSTHFVNC